MRCPKCNTGQTRVADSRLARNGLLIRRRRQCGACGHRFSTLEQIVREGLMVSKRDGRREPFEREKMLRGVRRACENRPVDPEQFDMLVSNLLADLQNQPGTEISSAKIAEIIMGALKKIDPVAHVRFACAYKEFREAGLRSGSDR